jgi:uncharacterized membrane protein
MLIALIAAIGFLIGGLAGAAWAVIITYSVIFFLAVIGS